MERDTKEVVFLYLLKEAVEKELEQYDSYGMEEYLSEVGKNALCVLSFHDNCLYTSIVLR